VRNNYLIRFGVGKIVKCGVFQKSDRVGKGINLNILIGLVEYNSAISPIKEFTIFC